MLYAPQLLRRDEGDTVIVFDPLEHIKTAHDTHYHCARWGKPIIHGIHFRHVTGGGEALCQFLKDLSSSNGGSYEEEYFKDYSWSYTIHRV